MIARHQNAVQPWTRIGQAATIGAVTAAELAALAVAASQQAFMEVFLLALILAGFGAAGAALMGFVFGGRRRDTLADLEQELAKATAILERGLIDEAQYNRIKGQIVEQYQYAPRSQASVLKWALWGASVGLVLPPIALLFSYEVLPGLFATAMAGIFGAVVSAAGTAAVLFARRKMAEHQLESGSSRPMLNAK
jgi:hypothetical protein